MIEKFASFYLARKGFVGTAKMGTDKYDSMVAGGWFVTSTWTATYDGRSWTITDYAEYERV